VDVLYVRNKMKLSEWLLKRKIKRATSDKEAWELFFNYTQDRIYRRGCTLVQEYHYCSIREPWKSIAFANQIWGSIGHNSIYQYLEDESVQVFDSVLESTFNVLGVGGFEVIADYRKRVSEDPEFWNREWHDHVFIYLPNTKPNLQPSAEADEVWQQYRDLFGRFWDASSDFESKAGAFLRAES
jgi:hypothetical protein